MNDLVKATLHSAWGDHFATGEGRILMALITKARDEQHMREIVRRELGEFWATFAQISLGVVKNQVTEQLFAPGVFGFLERSGPDAGIVMAKSQLNANFS